MYEAKYPGAEELVMVQVKQIEALGAKVALLEYGNIEGLILMSELTRRRIRSVNKLIRIGNIEPVIVVRVDESKGYIDLSKRRVAPEEVKLADDKYNKSKAVHSILRHVADESKVSMLSLYEGFMWDLAKRFNHAHDALAMAVRDEEAVLGKYNLEENIRRVLMTDVRRKLTPQPIKILALVGLECFAYEGIDAIKRALHAAINQGNEDQVVHVNLVSPPQYTLYTISLDAKEGIALLNKAIQAMGESISREGGKYDIKIAPKSITEEESKTFEAQMEKLNIENDNQNDRENDISGDDRED